jgi:mediator of RNA polymerase II transcription subunit 23
MAFHQVIIHLFFYCIVCLLLAIQAFPERFYFEGAQDINQSSTHQYLPIYFGNICLRFIPVIILLAPLSISVTVVFQVFDIVIHRLLESPVLKIWDSMLDQLGGLYKFHGQYHVACS